MFTNSVFELKHPEGAVLFNLSAFSDGPTSVIDRISEGVAGFYAWFRVYHFRDGPEEFADDLVAAIRAPKFLSRTGDIPPYYEVSLTSKSHIPEGKEKALRTALKDDEFRTSMRHAMEWSMLFQAPLYVGKSSNIKYRVGQHLKNGSPLRERLAAAGVEIDRAYLLIVPTPDQPSETFADTAADVAERPTSAYEILFEEVFSRLFNPTFTIRLG
jgi:hypothetical protein